MAAKKQKYTEKDLRAGIEDMNKFLNCDPALDLDDDMEMDDLIASFKEGAEMVQKEDKPAKATVALAKKLDVVFGPEGGEEEADEKEEEEKVEPPKDKKKDKKPADKKAPEKDSKPKYKRITAFCEVVKGTSKTGLTIEKIAEKTIALCRKNGLAQSAKLESVSWVLNYCMLPLVGMDVVTYDEEKKTYKYNS